MARGRSTPGRTARRRSGFQVPAEIRAPAIEGAVGHRSLTTAEVFELVDPSITWKDLEQLCGDFDLPVLVKGLMTGEDAALAVEHGAAGVVVSNHGGRQLDNAPATIDALPEVVEAVDGRVPVLLDGGIRRGTDVAVALAIGAEAVFVGRPALWGWLSTERRGRGAPSRSSPKSCGSRWPCWARPIHPLSPRITSSHAPR